MQITSSSSCSDHLMSPQVGVLEGGRCWTSPRAGQHGEEPLSDGVTSFSKCAPVTLVTSILYLLPGVSEAEGGVCKSSSASAKSLQSCPALCDPMDRLLCPRDSLGKNTGVGCHFLFQSLPCLSQ